MTNNHRSTFERGGPITRHTISDLRSAVRKLLAIVNRLRCENAQLRRDIAGLQAANEYLARRLK